MQTNDVGVLFASMQSAYGHRWAHKSDAVPVWQNALRRFPVAAVMRAAEKSVETYPDFPPSLGQFIDLVQYSAPALPSPDNAHDNATKAERIHAYTMPYDKVKNIKGNPHGVRLPDSVAQRQIGESVEWYEKRIATEVTYAMYPWLRNQP